MHTPSRREPNPGLDSAPGAVDYCIDVDSMSSSGITSGTQEHGTAYEYYTDSPSVNGYAVPPSDSIVSESLCWYQTELRRSIQTCECRAMLAVPIGDAPPAFICSATTESEPFSVLHPTHSQTICCTGLASASSNSIIGDDHWMTCKSVLKKVEYTSGNNTQHTKEQDLVADNSHTQFTKGYEHRYPALSPNMVIAEPEFQIAIQREMEALYGIGNEVVAELTPSDCITLSRQDVFDQSSKTTGLDVTTRTETCSARSCRWITGCSDTCDAQITWDNVPSHFRCFHGIDRLRQDIRIRCLWEGCSKELKRKYFVRHIRERHLGLRRTKKCRSV